MIGSMRRKALAIIAVFTVVAMLVTRASAYTILCSERQDFSGFSGLINFYSHGFIGYENNTSSSIKIVLLGVYANNQSSNSLLTGARFVASDGLETQYTLKIDSFPSSLEYGESILHDRMWNTVVTPSTVKNCTYTKNNSPGLVYCRCTTTTNLDFGGGHIIYCLSDNSITFG